MNTEQDTLTALLGGIEVSVTKLNGEKITVKVRQLPLRLLPNYMACMEDESATVELFCGKPKGFADEITPESCEAIIAEGEKLNLDFLKRYASRATARREKVMPGFQEKMLATLTDKLGSSLSTSQPKQG